MHNKINPKIGWLKGSAGIAQYAGVSRRTAARWMAGGLLDLQRLSPRLILVRPESVDALIASQSNLAAFSKQTHERNTNHENN
jgi:hypothetical protein